MQTFETSGPISLTLEVGVGDIAITAGARSAAVVDVQPSDPEKKADVEAARQTRVEFANGTLSVEAPSGWRHWTPFAARESIDLRIELPAGSSVRGSAGVAALRGTGALGDFRYRAGVGDIALERTGSLELKAGAGDVSVDFAEGNVEIKTAGAVRIGKIAGSAVIKNSNGDTWVGEVAGDARVNAANGAISVGLARDSIAAKTANGDVRLGAASRGPVVAQSALGTVEVGVPDGVPAWLDLETKFGQVRNDLTDAAPPGSGETAVEVHAQTAMGDIAIHRAPANGSREES